MRLGCEHPHKARVPATTPAASRISNHALLKWSQLSGVWWVLVRHASLLARSPIVVCPPGTPGSPYMFGVPLVCRRSQRAERRRCSETWC